MYIYVCMFGCISCAYEGMMNICCLWSSLSYLLSVCKIAFAGEPGIISTVYIQYIQGVQISLLEQLFQLVFFDRERIMGHFSYFQLWNCLTNNWYFRCGPNLVWSRPPESIAWPWARPSLWGRRRARPLRRPRCLRGRPVAARPQSASAAWQPASAADGSLAARGLEMRQQRWSFPPGQRVPSRLQHHLQE